MKVLDIIFKILYNVITENELSVIFNDVFRQNGE